MHAQSCLILCDPMDWSHLAPLSMDFSRQEYCHFLLQGIFLTQGSNSHLYCLLHCRWIFTTEPLGKFRYLEWIWIWMCTYLPIASKQERWVQSLGQEYPLEKGMVTHSSILAWKIPWTEALGWPQSMKPQKLDMIEYWHTHTHAQTTIIF